MAFSRRTLLTGAVAATALAGLSACGAGSASDALTIAADATPHSELLKEAVKLGLLGDVKLDIRETSGQVDPNQLVNSGDIDANFFQHVPYLKNWDAEHSADLRSVAAVHVEPLGLYSRKVTSLTDVPEGAGIAIPQDATNLGRALFVLADAGLIQLNVKAGDPDLDIAQVTRGNISANPKNLTFLEIDRPQLAATLDDAKVSLSIINGNYALEAGLIPSKDALAIEKAANNPYANVIVTRPDLVDDARITKLAEALTSRQIKDYITQTYSGSVVPA